jgi:hypothetical protein
MATGGGSLTRRAIVSASSWESTVDTMKMTIPEKIYGGSSNRAGSQFQHGSFLHRRSGAK